RRAPSCSISLNWSSNAGFEKETIVVSSLMVASLLSAEKNRLLTPSISAGDAAFLNPPHTPEMSLTPHILYFLVSIRVYVLGV
ncbi:MAG: hypothetical protein ACRES9_01445, partial [Gammaproteobacteria bacterium]